MAAASTGRLEGSVPALTVLMPVYNTEKYLRQALDSLCAQTFADFEVFCINDGSTDGSRGIIQEYMEADVRIRVIDKSNSGYGASLNRGIAQARGSYIGILEPDDFFEPDALQKLMGPALRTGADIVKANYWFYWSHPEDRNQQITIIDDGLAGRLFTAEEEPRILHSIPSIWSAVYRRELLQNGGLAFSETPGASFQDMGFSFKVFAAARSIYGVADPVLHYRQDNGQSSVNNPNKVFCVCDELDGVDAFVDADKDRAWMKPYAFRLRYDSYIWNFERLAPSLRERFLPRMKDDFDRGVAAGSYRPDLFGSWQRKNFELVRHDPKRFLDAYPVDASRMKKALYYLKLGGPKLLLDAYRR